MYHTWDEKGQGGNMSGLEQAQRFVKGRTTTLKRVATQAKQRADKPLNANHQYTLSKFKKDGTAGAPKSEAKPLADRGLIQSISGKGRGQGNTPQWELTPKGKALLAPSRDAASTLPATVRIGGGTKVYHVVGETDTHYRVTNTPGSSMTFRVAKKDAST